MPTRTEFKFNCPICGQHILAATEWSGRKIECPSCLTKITIPSAIEAPPKPIARPSSRAPEPIKAQAGPPALHLVSPKARTDAKGKPTSAAPKEPEQPRVAALTPAIKLDMVRSVRRRIKNEASWLPSKVNGKNAYAGKVEKGETKLLDPKDPEATQFSLIGGFLLEFHLRKVVRTAAGRTRLLDTEIPDAIREVWEESAGEAAAQVQSKDSASEKTPPPLSHSQCLAALDLLEERYSERMDVKRIEKAKRELGAERLPDLVRKLKRQAPISADDVATALYHELMEVHRRLDTLEARSNP